MLSKPLLERLDLGPQPGHGPGQELLELFALSVGASIQPCHDAGGSKRLREFDEAYRVTVARVRKSNRIAGQEVAYARKTFHVKSAADFGATSLLVSTIDTGNKKAGSVLKSFTHLVPWPRKSAAMGTPYVARRLESAV